ncbi:MAG: putative manganese-dependent inorganic diphosphatase [Selenomonadales bacterium]|nr:putative manganese-dependent inorganic diphosphatase [Selenomonadales bacterium]
MKTQKPVYVIGHRNPDTDSICSALAYAHLKRETGESAAIAARAGQLNAETQFALDTFGVEAPVFLTDVYPRIKDVMEDVIITANEDATIREVGMMMHEYKVKAVPIVAEGNILKGIVTVSDLARRYFDEMQLEDLAKSGITLRDVKKGVDGTVLCGDNLDRKVCGRVFVAAGELGFVRETVQEHAVVLVGGRYAEIEECLAKGVDAIILTCGAQMPAELLKQAEEKGVLVIATQHNTLRSVRLLYQAVPAASIMKTDLTTFEKDELVSEMQEIIRDTNFNHYPVVENGKLIGVIRRDNLVVPEKEKIILVDHNEKGQAVEGLGSAKIVEMIDHHRLGGLETSDPIFIRYEPVGCTCTIVANLYWQYGVAIPQNIAGLLLSAILSDTVLFKSPTCTQKDKDAAAKLAEIAGVDLYEYGMNMLKAGSGIGDMTIPEIVANDMKEFKMGDYLVAVSQLSVMDTKEVLDLKAELLAQMESVNGAKGYQMYLMMVTDILEEGTFLLAAGGPQAIVQEAFGKLEDNMIYLPGVMSRKKQIIPPMVNAAQNH